METTGFSPQNGEKVIEIGAVTIENQSIIAEFSSLIDAGKRIPWHVQQVHGITNEKYLYFTDIAKAKEGDSRAADIIKNWIRNRVERGTP